MNVKNPYVLFDDNRFFILFGWLGFFWGGEWGRGINNVFLKNVITYSKSDKFTCMNNAVQIEQPFR